MNKEELRKEAREYLSKRDWHNEKVYNLMADFAESKLTPQAKESELIEDIENILYKHIKAICKINSIIDDITQFRNHQNNKDE